VVCIADVAGGGGGRIVSQEEDGSGWCKGAQRQSGGRESSLAFVAAREGGRKW
jgi:hypothetical protein